MAENRHNYELMFIVNPELGEEETETVLNRIQGYLKEAGGQVFSFKEWGVRRLAYTLKGHREGRYHLATFTMDPQNVANFRRDIMMLDDVLREIVVRLEEDLEGKPLAMEDAIEPETLEDEALPPQPEEAEPIA